MTVSIIFIPDFEKSCRLCLSENDLIPIYQQSLDGSSISVATKINSTTSIQVSDKDDLPGQLCKNCYQRINEWYDFKLACHNTDSILRQYIKVKEDEIDNTSGTHLLQKDMITSQYQILTVVSAEETIEETGDLSKLQSAPENIEGSEGSEGCENIARDDVGKVGFGGLGSSVVSQEEMVRHLSCQVCGKTFSRYNNRMTHEKKYHKLSNGNSALKKISEEKKILKYACKICPRKFSRLDNLKTHELRIHSRERSFVCECGTGFVRMHDMIWHQNTHIKKREGATSPVDRQRESHVGSVECSLCFSAFSSTEKLKDHIELAHLDDHFQCSVCLSKFVSAEELLWHQKHPDEKVVRSVPPDTSFSEDHLFICKICNHGFSHYNLGKVHVLRMHSSYSRSQVNPCYHQFNDKVVFAAHDPKNNEVHVQSHERSKEKESDFDGNVSNPRSTFKDPKMCVDNWSLNDEHSYVSKHSNTGKGQSYFCSYCGKEFNKLASVNSHEKCHTNERPYTCKDCGKAFMNLSKMKRHTLIHLGVKPFTCDVCHLSFRSSSNLMVHKKRHSSKSEFACNICDKAFLSLSGLKRHEMLHNGKKKFSCEECGKSFYTATEQVRHMKYHTGSKTHACQYCDKRFYESGHLTIHVRTRHVNQSPHSCQICSCSFATKSRLKRHENSDTHLKKIKNVSQSSISLPEWGINNTETEEGFRGLKTQEIPGSGPNIYDDSDIGGSDDEETKLF